LQRSVARTEVTMPIPCVSVDQQGWLTLREQLWPHCSRERHLTQMAEFIAAPQKFAQYLEFDSAGAPIGLVEAALRSDYVNGTTSSPVVFLEGIYVVPSARRQGIARALVACIDKWAVAAGCTEFASDADLGNLHSHRMHRALGFEESGRVVYFRKGLV
jgi:aminoglycoside 6'-N-acetyltransferase I